MSGNKKVLDTNIVLYLLAGDNTIADFLQGVEAYVSVVTELELIGYPDINSKELKSIKSFLEDCTIVGISEPIKEIYIDLRKKYRLKMGDDVAAATAIYLGLPFISADKDFTKVTELNFAFYTP